MIVGFTSCMQLGCTFLNWSLHYLSGDTRYWYEKEKSWLGLTKTPLTDINSHFFKKNHPQSIIEWKKIINSFLSRNDNDNNFSFYGHVSNDAAKDLPLYKENFTEAISFSLNKKIKLIYLGTDYSIYSIVSRHAISILSDYKSRNLFYKKNIKEYFNTLPNCESLIDTNGKTRDFLSLAMNNFSPPLDQEIIKSFSSHKNFYFINCQQLVKNGKECLTDMFNFLNLKINSSRMDTWLAIHARWKEHLMPILNFYEDLPTILSSIIGGISHPLKKYRLDIFTEAVIQHELMKQHRDRLLISHLDKFPNNTKELTPFLKSVIATR
jgi:hypothetical protein